MSLLLLESSKKPARCLTLTSNSFLLATDAISHLRRCIRQHKDSAYFDVSPLLAWIQR